MSFFIVNYFKNFLESLTEVKKFSMIFKMLVRKIKETEGATIWELENNLALKEIQIEDNWINQDNIAEIDILSRVDHPNVVNIKKIMLTDSKIQIIMDLALIDLFEYINPSINIIIREKLISDIIDGLNYLHQNHIIHGDFHLRNVLIFNSLENPIPKIIDFGLARNSYSKTDMYGPSSQISPPELLKARLAKKNIQIGPEVDVWSLGCMIYYILSGQLLFNVVEEKEILSQISSKQKEISTYPLVERILSQPRPTCYQLRGLAKKIPKETLKTETSPKLTNHILMCHMISSKDIVNQTIHLFNKLKELNEDVLLTFIVSFHLIFSVMSLSLDLESYNEIFQTNFDKKDFTQMVKKSLIYLNFKVFNP